MARRVRSVAPKRAPATGGPKPRVIGPFSILAGKLLIAAGICSGGALAYLIYGLASGHIGAFPNPPGGSAPMPPAAQAALTDWVTTAISMLAWGAAIAALLAMARYYESSSPILAAGAIGGFLYLGLPALIAFLLQQSYHSPNALTEMMVGDGCAAGKVILVVTAVRGTSYIFISALRRPKRVRVVVTPQGASRMAMRPRSLIPQCWNLAHCRSVTGACPRLRQRRSCWKVGVGCLCDIRLAEQVADGSAAWAHEEAAALRYRAGRTRACLTCPVYEEHQALKFRLLQWLAYPLTAGIMFLARSPLHVAYDRSLQFLDRTIAMLTFVPNTTGPAAGGMHAMVLSSNVEWVFIGCLWLLLVSYALQTIEHVTFRWGW
jgi:hypothetical protein